VKLLCLMTRESKRFSGMCEEKRDPFGWKDSTKRGRSNRGLLMKGPPFSWRSFLKGRKYISLCGGGGDEKKRKERGGGGGWVKARFLKARLMRKKRSRGRPRRLQKGEGILFDWKARVGVILGKKKGRRKR